jgi:hypothetical protein
MKIRIGFVSNSSSCSFCIYGLALYEGDLRKMLGLTDDGDNDNDFCSDDIAELFQKAGINDIEIQYGPESSDLYIGKDWCKIGDDQTGKQFKEDIEKKIKKILKKTDLKFGTHEEAWESR